jgi:hypothetical protein
MIPIPSGVHVWIATGHTGMRRGMNGLKAGKGWPSKKRSVQSSATARRKVTSAATTAKAPPKSDEPKVEQVIRRVHMAHRGRYGAPRIHAALRAEGHTASPGRV